MRYIYIILAVFCVISLCASDEAKKAKHNTVIVGLADNSLLKPLHELAKANKPKNDQVSEIAYCVSQFKTEKRYIIEFIRKRCAKVGPSAVSELLKLLEHPNGDVSGNALVCLYFVAPQETLPLIVANLDNETSSFMDYDVMGETIGSVCWIYLFESIDDWPFSEVDRRVSVATRKELKPKVLKWFSTIKEIRPQKIQKYGWPKVSIDRKESDNK